MKKHFVTFLSPGTFVAEQTTKEIEAWDTDRAVEMSKDVQERYGATPYGFYFSTRGRGPGDLDSKEIQRSGMYYLGGTVFTLAQVKAWRGPGHYTLIRNMENNGFGRIVVNGNSWQVTHPLMEGDVVLGEGADA